MIFALLAAAGFVAGFMNVLAGGGSFVTLPAMVASGLTALGANASSTVALFPAQAITTWLARRDMVMPDDAGGISVRALAAISTIGGLFGGLLLLVTPPGIFARIVPWLILFATLVFAQASFGGGIAANGRFRLPRTAVYVVQGVVAIYGGYFGGGIAANGRFRLPRTAVYVVQGVVAIYGGYFGGGIGIMMLAALILFGLTDIKVMTSIKILLAMLMNVAAVGTFVVAGLVAWPQTLVLMGGAIGGGAVGIVAARHVPASWVRVFVVLIGLTLTVVFFLRQNH